MKVLLLILISWAKISARGQFQVYDFDDDGRAVVPLLISIRAIPKTSAGLLGRR
jgi:hypothetical protein